MKNLVTLENEYRKVLTSIRADEINHHGRKLSDHLIGTYSLLATWGNSEEVAAAGAFHSIYGTEEFGIRAVPLSQRESIRHVIGKEAEELAYLFCVANRRLFYKLSDNPPFHITIPSSDDKNLEITPYQYASLLEIEVANIVEQALHETNVPANVVNFWIEAFDSKSAFISQAATDAYRSVLSGYVKCP